MLTNASLPWTSRGHRRASSSFRVLPFILAFATVGVGCEDDTPSGIVGARDAGPRADTGVVVPPRLTDDICLSIVYAGNGASAILADGDLPGIAAFAHALEDAPEDSQEACRAAHPETDAPVIRIWSGDTFAPSVAAEVSLVDRPRSIDGELFSVLPFDVMVIGDRDLAFGPDVLADFITDLAGFEMARRPFLASTLEVGGESSLVTLAEADDDDEPASQSLFQKVVVESEGHRVGVVSVLDPELAFVSSPRNASAFDLDEIVGAVDALIDELKTIDEAERVILVAHTGDAAEDRGLARRLMGFDVLVSAAGTGAEANVSPPEAILDASGRPIPVVAVRGGYHSLGVLRVYFDANGFQVVNPDAAILAVDPAPTVIEIDGIVGEFEEDFSEVTAARAATDVTISTELAREDDANGGHLVADAALFEARARGPEWTGLAPSVIQAAIVPAQELGATEIDPGDLTEEDVRELVTGDGVLATTPSGELLTSGALKEILEVAAASLDADGGTFLQVAGLQVTIDPLGAVPGVDEMGRPVSGTRVRRVVADDEGTVLVEDGMPVAGTQIRLVAPGYLFQGVGYPRPPVTEFRRLGASFRTALRNYLDEIETIDEVRYGPAAPARIIVLE